MKSAAAHHGTFRSYHLPQVWVHAVRALMALSAMRRLWQQPQAWTDQEIRSEIPGRGYCCMANAKRHDGIATTETGGTLYVVMQDGQPPASSLYGGRYGRLSGG